MRRFDRLIALNLLEGLADVLTRHGDVEPPGLRPRLCDYRIRHYDHGEWIQFLRALHRGQAYR